MLIEKVSIEQLKEPPYNPRKSVRDDPEFHKKLTQSLQSFGYIEPIVWNKRTGFVVGGNQRLQVLKDMGEKEVEVVIVDFDDPTEKAANLALNKVSGEWDMPKLQELMASLDKDIQKLTGFENEEIKKLLRKLNQLSKDPEEIPEAPVAITKPGDLIILGEHRLLCGDSLQSANIDRLMEGNKGAMIFTDPPYNCNYGSTLMPSKRSKTRPTVTGSSNGAVTNDNMDTDEWKVFCNSLYEVYKQCCEGDIYQWGASGPEGMRSRLWLVEAGCHWSTTIIWAKD